MQAWALGLALDTVRTVEQERKHPLDLRRSLLDSGCAQRDACRRTIQGCASAHHRV